MTKEPERPVKGTITITVYEDGGVLFNSGTIKGFELLGIFRYLEKDILAHNLSKNKPKKKQ